MRRLLPTYAESVDLDEAYAYPDGVPWLRANMVASVDGAIAVDGRSGGLSGAADKRVFGVLRNLADLVLVGAGTARAEGYAGVRPSEARVAWRRARGLSDVPAIAVVTRAMELDPASGLFRGTTVPTVVVTTEAAAEARGSLYGGADLVVMPGDAVDIGSAVDALIQKGFRRILCEGGPHLLGEVAAAGRLDELCLTVSPLLVSGAGGRLLTGGPLGPLPATLTQVLEEDGFLFAQYSTR